MTLRPIPLLCLAYAVGMPEVKGVDAAMGGVKSLLAPAPAAASGSPAAKRPTSAAPTTAHPAESAPRAAPARHGDQVPTVASRASQPA